MFFRTLLAAIIDWYQESPLHQNSEPAHFQQDRDVSSLSTDIAYF
jgi:hypothetical protein